MAALQVSDIADLAVVAQKELGEMKITNLTSDIQDHVAMNTLLRKNNVDFLGAGSSIQWNVMTRLSGAARNVGLYQTDDVNVADVTTTASIPWRFTDTSYAMDVREVAMNATPRKIFDLVKLRRADAYGSLAELMEANFWGKPSSSSDTATPYGIRYWIVPNASEGFNGGHPSGFSDVAGLSSTTYPRHKNYTAQFTNVTRTDLIRKWREAATKTKFKVPMNVNLASYNSGDKYGYYTNYNILGKLEERLEDQNDNLGNDVASKDGNALFRKVPVTYVSYLDATNQTDITDPVYGINWGVLKTCFMRGQYFRESKPREAPKQHNVLEAFVDLMYNIKCTDRRRLFVLYVS